MCRTVRVHQCDATQHRYLSVWGKNTDRDFPPESFPFLKNKTKIQTIKRANTKKKVAISLKSGFFLNWHIVLENL